MKTEHYGLKLWGAREGLRREGVNGNFEVVDEVLNSIAQAANREIKVKEIRIVTGSYTGTGTSSRLINLGSRPTVVLLSARGCYRYTYQGIQVEGGESDSGALADQGFTVTGVFNESPSYSGSYYSGAELNPYTYVAIWAEA